MFRTADDGGKTTRVEVYRSENTSFTADSGSRRTTISIGSNQNGSYNDIVGDCNKTYFYVLRAFDSADNGSGLVGDSVTVTTTTTTTTGTTTTVSNPGTSTGTTTGGGGAIPVTNVTLAAGETEGEVQGAEEVNQEETSGANTSNNNESVLGEKTQKDKDVFSNALNWVANRKVIILSILGLVALILGAIYYVKNKKRNSEKSKKEWL